MKPEFPTSDQEQQLRDLWKLAFGDPESFITLFFTTGYSPDHCQCIALEGKTVAALHWLDASFRGQRFAYIYGVATHPDYRGRGLCRALLSQTHRLLQERGYGAALLTPAGPGLRRMYGGMGYEDCCTIGEHCCTAGAPVALQRVTAGEYGRLRQGYLPAGGVTQEGRSLDFLGGYCQLWAGEDFLLAAQVDGGSLMAYELLGNAQAAPGILAALGCREGCFRVPGGETERTMWYPLTQTAEKPSYFGLSFD